MYRFELKESDYAFNASLDPFLVLKRMGFTESSIYQEGNIIRIHCPIHRDLVRKSMIIDIEERTFKCQYSQCDAYEGGLLIELVALYFDCPIEEVTKNLFGDEDKSSDLLFRGEMYINKGMHEEALPYLEQAVALDPRNETTRCKLAALMLELNRKDDSYREYMAAAESYAVRGELEKTLSIYNILIILQPGAVKARKELAFLFSRMGRPDAAADQLKWVVDFYMKYGQVRGAQESIESMLELDPNNGVAHYLLADIHRQGGRKGPAADALEKAAALLIENRQASRAAQAMEELAELRPGSPRLERLRENLAELERELATERGIENPSQMDEEIDEQNFLEWLDMAESSLQEGMPLVSPAEGQEEEPSAEAVVSASEAQAAKEGRSAIESHEISPEDRRIELCLNDMRELSPEQLEKMRQQLIGMFNEVRKTYEDGFVSEWEMKTIRDFYKAFCVAVDQHRRRQSAVAQS